MTGKPTHTNNTNFFTLDVRINKADITILKNKTKKNQSKTNENEWIQEYELIYLSQKHENWNLEDTPTD